MSNNLNGARVAPGQSSKEQTINDSIGAVDAAITETTSVDMTAGALTMTAANYAASFELVITGATAAAALTLPAQKKLSRFRNATTSTITLTVGTTTIALQGGSSALVYTDGTVNGLATAGASLPPGGLTGQVLTKSSATDGDVKWATPSASGGGGGSSAGTTPLIVQKAFGHQNSGAIAVTLPAAPTQGNLLVAITIGQDSYAAGAGWTLVSTADGTNSSGQQMRTGVATKVAGAGESATQTPSNGSYAYIYEVSGFAASDGSGVPEITNVAMAASMVGNTFTGTMSAVPVNSLVLGVAFDDDNGAIPSLTGSNFALDSTDSGIAGHYFGAQGFHWPVSVTGDYTINGTVSNGTLHPALTMVALKPGGASSSSSGSSGSSSSSSSGATSTGETFSPPVSTDYSVALNDGTDLIVADDAKAGLLFYVNYDNSLPGGDRIRVRTRAVPANTDWSVVARLKFTAPLVNYNNVGLVIYAAGQPTACIFGLHFDGGGSSGVMTTAFFNQSGTGFSSSTNTPFSVSSANLYIKMVYVAATDALTLSVSSDGVLWTKVKVTTATGFLGAKPTNVGFGMGPNNTSGATDYGQVGASCPYLVRTGF